MKIWIVEAVKYPCAAVSAIIREAYLDEQHARSRLTEIEHNHYNIQLDVLEVRDHPTGGNSGASSGRRDE